MRLVIFGLTVSSSWGNGHATLWRGLIRALTHRGHRVCFFERDVPYYAQHRDLTSLADGELILYTDWKGVDERARGAIQAADVSIISSFCPDTEAANRLMVNNAKGLKIFYDLDTPVTLDEYSRTGSVPYLPSNDLAGFDLVLSFTGGVALSGLVRRLGARKVVTLYGHADPQVHRRSDQENAFLSDLSYLGTYAKDRQPILKEMFLEPARQMPRMRFTIAGAIYPEKSIWPQNVRFVHHLPPSKHSSFFSSSKMTLNITRTSMAAMGFCPSGRLFEAASCQTPVLSDQWAGIEEFFEPGKEILLARNSDEVTDLLSADSAMLAEIGQAAHRRLLSQHTSDHRAREFESIVSQI